MMIKAQQAQRWQSPPAASTTFLNPKVPELEATKNPPTQGKELGLQLQSISNEPQILKYKGSISKRRH